MHINYIEFSSTNLNATKKFFTEVFGWEFVDYGDGYSAFNKAGVKGGFYQGEICSRSESGGALVVMYSDSLEKIQLSIEQSGGDIIKPIFSFPGGRRFHFIEPGGNELAIWSYK